MILLDGCRTEPLGSYLQGLGAWRAIVRVLDSNARARWASGHLELETRVPKSDLVARFVESFEPLPIVSPWNSGSGFANNGKSKEAERALAIVRGSMDRRLAALRDAIVCADAVVERGKQLGWGGKGEDLWDKSRKCEVVQLCRNMLPDAALAWIDTAVVLGRDRNGEGELSYSRLLGTGGNFGRQDLQSTYIQRVFAVLDDARHAKSPGWLRAALFGEESMPYLRDSVGQFDPGRAGGIQSSPLEKRDDQGFANPWSFLLTIEGAILFASAATRRAGAGNSGASLPFLVRASGVGFGSAADGEGALGEIWTPEWDRLASLPEIEQLLGEGRADWRGGPARSGLDFVRSIASLGVDRGIRRFTRSMFVERHGQNPLAVPVGVIDVRERSGVPLLRQVDGWLDKLRGGDQSSAVQAGVRSVDRAMYEMAAGDESDAALGVLAALGSLHEAVAKSSKARERVKPLIVGDAAEWRKAIAFDRPEARLAYAFATSGSARKKHDATGWVDTPLRYLVTGVIVKGNEGRGNELLDWAKRPSQVNLGQGIAAALAAAHARRALPGVVDEPNAREDEKAWPAPAVRGMFSAFRSGTSVELADLCSFAGGEIDEGKFEALVLGLLLLDRRDASAALNASSAVGIDGGVAPDLVVPPVLALLLPFFADSPLTLRLEDEGPLCPVVLRPGSEWLSQLRAGHLGRVVDDAAKRLRAAGIRSVAASKFLSPNISGERLAAVLMLKVRPYYRIAALDQVAALPSQSRLADDEEGASA